MLWHIAFRKFHIYMGKLPSVRETPARRIKKTKQKTYRLYEQVNINLYLSQNQFERTEVVLLLVSSVRFRTWYKWSPHMSEIYTGGVLLCAQLATKFLMYVCITWKCTHILVQLQWVWVISIRVIASCLDLKFVIYPLALGPFGFRVKHWREIRGGNYATIRYTNNL